MLYNICEIIIEFLSAFNSFNSGDIILLSVVLLVILREDQVNKFILKSNITILLIYYYAF
jgi:hypothetical protein